MHPVDSDDSASSGSEAPSPGVIRSPNGSSRSSKSRSASSDSESNHSGPKSPNSSDNGPKSPSSGNSGLRSPHSSRPQSPDSHPRSPDSRPQSPDSVVSRPTTPKSPDSVQSNHRSSPDSRFNVESCSNSPASRKSPGQVDGYKNSHGKSPFSNHDDKNSNSSSRKSSSPDRLSGISLKSGSSRESRKRHEAADLDDGNTSDSSVSSVDSSSRKNKNVARNLDTQPEEISDGDMESDHEQKVEEKSQVKVKEIPANMQHEDLSDVSDLDESIGGPSDDEESKVKDLRQKLDENKTKKSEVESKKVVERTSRTEEGEEQLDFEAEDGECAESEPSKENLGDLGKLCDDDRRDDKEPEELEEGELTDEDDARPEETEPRPVCRFFSRGQCTWGASCRFLHPGVTDKGNYTMFELIRPIVPGDYRDDRLTYGARPEQPPPVESAWERGLRTAKEMLRKSIKRKEQDIDFEEKKMNLSLAQEELDKENGYYARAPSPEPSRYVSVRHAVPVEYVRPPPPEEYYGRRQVIYEPERIRTAYREVRVPEYYPPAKYEEEPAPVVKAVPRRPKREVIVQRVEERPARGDEWSDPWMRSKSPAGRKGARRRSYSSGSSYSSSSTSRSSSATSRSSFKSRSRSPHHKRSPRAHKSRQVSPSVIVSERKAAIERAALMNPPAPRKKAPSPGMMRAGAQNPPAPSKVDQFGRTRSKLAAAVLARAKVRKSSRSSSGSSSGSSSSDSDSSASSSSSSRDASPSPRHPSGVDLALALKAKAIDALKSGSEKRQIKLNLKTPTNAKKPDISELARKAEAVQGKKRPANSPPGIDVKGISNKKATSRREELLKQLKAVEDAIAKKRSKV